MSGTRHKILEAEAAFEVGTPNCGNNVAFFKDDTFRKCGGCGHRFVSPKTDFGCAAYCLCAENTIYSGVDDEKKFSGNGTDRSPKNGNAKLSAPGNRRQ